MWWELTSRTLSRIGMAGLAVLLLILPQLVSSAYTMILINQAGFFMIVVLGLYFTLGLTGQLSLAQTAFWGVGAYASALVTVKLGLPIPVGMLAAVLSAGVLGIIVGVPTLRLKGLYLAMVTIAFVQFVYLVLKNWLSLTGGPNGISRIPYPNLGFVVLSTSWNYYYFMLAFLVLLIVLALRVTRSSLGRAMIATRESQIAAEAMGINVSRVKITAFIFSAVYAGISGSLYAHRMTYINPDQFIYDETIRILSALLIGGQASVVGALVGGGLIAMLPEWLRFLQKYYMAIYGGSVVLFMLFLPKGVVSLPAKALEEYRRRRRLAKVAVEEPDLEDVPAITLQPRTSNQIKGRPLLQTAEVTMTFGGLTAVNRVSLDVAVGEIRGLIGPNGSGKTTLMNVISGIYSPTSGQIDFDGKNITGVPVAQIAQMGMSRTFQTIRLFDDMTVVENVMAAKYFASKANLMDILLRTRRFRADEVESREQSLAALEVVGLGRRAGRRAGDLPYGERRLLEIARGIATNPGLLLLDEPAAGMNPREKGHLMKIIARLRDMGITILLIEHDMSVVMNLADRVACLNFGQKISDGTPREIQQDEQVIEAYLGRKRAHA